MASDKTIKKYKVKTAIDLFKMMKESPIDESDSGYAYDVKEGQHITQVQLFSDSQLGSLSATLHYSVFNN